MACLDNYISIYGHCDGATPSSGLHINKNLPGISLKAAANFAESEFNTGVALLNEAIETGIKQARSSLISEMLGTVKFNSIVSGGQYGRYEPDFSDPDNYLPSAAANRGLKFELKNDCRLSTMFVRRVQVLLNTTVTDATLTITDGTKVTTKTFSATAGQAVYVETNYKAESGTILITLNNASISVANSSLYYNGSCGNCGGTCSGNCNSGLSIWGWDGTNTTGTTYGLSALVDVICDEEKFFCEISHIPDVAWMCLYQAGIFAFEYALQSGRVNVYTNYGKEQIGTSLEQWRQQFEEKKKSVVGRLPKHLLSIDACCLECNSSRWQTSIP